MEGPIATQTRYRLEEDDCVRSEPGLFFRNKGQAPNRLQTASPWSIAPASMRWVWSKHCRRAALLAAAGAFGLLAYGSTTWFGPDRAPGTKRHETLAAPSGAVTINLPPPNLLRPLSPDEAAKENADRPFIGRADSPASRFVLHTDVSDSSRALTCLAQAVYYEAAGEGEDGGRAVAQVVLNRLHHPGYPSTICGVVYEGGERASGCQFSFVCDGSMQRIPVPWLWSRSRQIAQEALAGRVFAPIGHATHYHADYVLPYWADSLDKSVQVGRHIFYRLRAVFGDARAFSQRYGGAEPAFREPGSPVVIPPEAVAEQLANALISDGLQGAAKDADKVSPQPASPLAVDSTRGTLLADSDGAPQQTRRQKLSTECSASVDHKQLAPLGANNMRSSAGGSGC